MSRLTTHVLDASGGDPAAGVEIVLTDGVGDVLEVVVTDADGRATLGPDPLPPGDHTLTFRTGPWFAAKGVSAFHPSVAVTFTVEVERDGSIRHHHVPLLVSPFAYTTYRGS